MHVPRRGRVAVGSAGPFLNLPSEDAESGTWGRLSCGQCSQGGVGEPQAPRARRWGGRSTGVGGRGARLGRGQPKSLRKQGWQ